MRSRLASVSVWLTLVRLTQASSSAYLPIMWVDELSQRLDDQVRVNQTDTEASLDLIYRQVEQIESICPCLTEN